MKKTILANYGQEGKGKSDTIRRILNMIIEKYPNAVTESFKFSSVSAIKLMVQIGEIKIGIDSQDDPNGTLISSLQEYADKNCDMIICSTRSSGDTYYAVRELHQTHNYDIIWFTNYRSKEIPADTLNHLSALHIFSLIEILLEDQIALIPTKKTSILE